MRATPIATASKLAGLGALHVGWGVGSSFPFADRRALANGVAGTTAVPGPRECFAVTVLLLGASGLVADALPVGTKVRRAGLIGISLVLAGRGAIGVTGRTGSIVPWTPSAHFTELDQRYYGPLCLALAAGTLAPSGDHRRGTRGHSMLVPSGCWTCQVPAGSRQAA